MKFDFRRWFHSTTDPAVLRGISQVLNKMETLMATAKDVLELAKVLKASVDTLEADVTAALAKLPSIPADVQADIDEAFATMTLTVADAADKVDEAKP